MTINILPGGTVKVSAPTPSFTQVKPPSAPGVLVIPMRGLPGDPGEPGPANTLTKGTVGTGAADFTITGTAPNQILNLVLPPGPPGADSTVPGPAGRSVSSIVRTSGTGAPGTTDTYTITYSDATTSTFQVYNGANGTGSITSVNGNTGPAVVLAAADVGAPPTTRTVTAGTGLTGGGDLSANRTLAVSYGTAAGTAAQGNDSRITGAAQKANNLSDLASAATALANLGGVPTTRTINAKALSANVTLAASDVGAVPTSTTVNGHALSANVTVTAADTGAAANVSGGAEKTFAFSATTGTITGDLSQGSCSTQLTPSGNFTVALSNVPASGTACTVTIIITSGATAYTASWPAGTDWGVTSPPTLTAGKSTVVTLLTVNGGATWHARAA